MVLGFQGFGFGVEDLQYAITLKPMHLAKTQTLKLKKPFLLIKPLNQKETQTPKTAVNKRLNSAIPRDSNIP